MPAEPRSLVLFMLVATTFLTAITTSKPSVSSNRLPIRIELGPAVSVGKVIPFEASEASRPRLPGTISPVGAVSDGGPATRVAYASNETEAEATVPQAIPRAIEISAAKPLPVTPKPLPNGSHRVRGVIDEELSDSPTDERDIWFEELQNVPAEVVRDLLKIRRELKGMHAIDLGRSQTWLSIEPNGTIGVVPAGPVTPSLGPAATSLVWNQAVEIHRQNLLNCRSIGYKRQIFVMNRSREQEQPAINVAICRPQDSACSAPAFRTDWSQGRIERTGRPLDVAIEGDGFFEVVKNRQVFLTRNGLLNRSSEGLLGVETLQGHLPLTPEIRIPLHETPAIDTLGNVWGIGEDPAAGPQLRGRLVPKSIPDRSSLKDSGDALYAILPPFNKESGLKEAPSAKIVVGALELSNVNFAEEKEQFEHARYLREIESNR